jgi:hypothetical protein
MRNPPTNRVLRSAWTANRLAGRLRFPVARYLANQRIGCNPATGKDCIQRASQSLGPYPPVPRGARSRNGNVASRNRATVLSKPRI